MTPCDDLIAKAMALETDRMVNLSAKASLSLALPPLTAARQDLIQVQARMARITDEIAGVLAGDHGELAEHTFEAPHYSKVMTCGLAARYRTAYATLADAIARAEASAREHQRALRSAEAA